MKTLRDELVLFLDDNCDFTGFYGDVEALQVVLADRILKLVEERLPKEVSIHPATNMYSDSYKQSVAYNQAITDMKKGLGI